MSQVKKAAKSVIVVIIFSVFGKFLGFAREVLIGQKFGSTMETDTFILALSAISLFTTLITEAMKTTMIPVLSEVERKEGRSGKLSHTNNLINIVGAVSLVVIVAGFFAAPILIKIFAPGFKEEHQFNLAVLLIRIGLPTVFLSGIQAIFGGYLQTENRFVETAGISLPMNLVYISFLVSISSNFGIIGLMVTHVLAIASQFFMYVRGLKKVGFKYQWKCEIKDEYIKKILYLVPPVLISVGISDINKIIDRSMGSTLIVGSISSLNYADRLSTLITGIFILAITTVMYPMFSKEVSSGNQVGLKKTIINGINIILLITIPATVGMILLAHPIVKFAYERGLFDSVATIMTAGALIYSSMRMMSTGINTLLRNVYYSFQNTKTPVIVGAIAVVVNVTFNLLLIKSMGHLGLALATTISSIVTSIVLLITLRKKIGSFGFSSSVKVGFKASIATLAMGIVVYFLHGYLINNLTATRPMEAIALASSVLIGMLVYFVLIILFKIEEVDWVLGLVKAKFKNR